jgi:hypothetical protein
MSYLIVLPSLTTTPGWRGLASRMDASGRSGCAGPSVMLARLLVRSSVSSIPRHCRTAFSTSRAVTAELACALRPTRYTNVLPQVMTDAADRIGQMLRAPREANRSLERNPAETVRLRGPGGV